MRLDTLASVVEHPAGRMRLSGQVCGIDACEIVADRDEILVGSALECDLVIPDPLIPPRAFRVRRRKCHAGTESDCRCRWSLEALGGARVCVNGSLTRRESLADGDIVSIGCHALEFRTRAAAPRNFRTNRNVSDICRRLVAERTAPAGFLDTTPTRGYLRRRRLAIRAVAALAAILAVCFLFTPRLERFESAPMPLEITIADLDTSAATVRPLSAVERRRFDAVEPAEAAADLADAPTPLPDFAATPVDMAAEPPPAEPVALDRPLLDVADLPPVPVPAPAAEPLARQPVPLAAAPTERRRIDRPADGEDAPMTLAEYTPVAGGAAATAVSMATEVAQAEPAALDRPTIDVAALPTAPVPVTAAPSPVRQRAALAAAPTERRRVDRPAPVGEAPQELAAYAPAAVTAAAARPVATRLTAPTAAPAPAALTGDRSVTLAQLDKAAASPVAFETIQGLRVPVARIASQLEELAVAAPAAAKPVVDGIVTVAEMEASWKSGRFKRHAPGNPPPDADPPTQCFVSKADVNGQPCLYIAFVCTDPDLGKLQADAAQGDEAALIRDDSVEVFLDVDSDRVNYHQLIVNARGAYWTAFHPKPLMESGGQPQPWDCKPSVKTTINVAAGQWTCEIMLPFASLGGVPAPGTRWGVNFCRNFRGQGEDWQLQTWFAVFDGQRDFHHPSRFGVFQW